MAVKRFCKPRRSGGKFLGPKARITGATPAGTSGGRSCQAGAPRCAPMTCKPSPAAELVADVLSAGALLGAALTYPTLLFLADGTLEGYFPLPSSSAAAAASASFRASCSV